MNKEGTKPRGHEATKMTMPSAAACGRIQNPQSEFQHRSAFAPVCIAALAALAAPLAADEAPARQGDWPMWGGRPDRNMVSDEIGIPAEWDIKTGRNIKWKAALGSQTYGNPVIAGGRILVGTNNDGNLRSGISGDKGVVLCFDEKTGKLLWQATHDKLAAGRVNDWPQQGICSTAFIDGDRAYYVSNRCELVCVDMNGFANGNDGPYKDEKYTEPQDADFVWIYDMIEELGVFPHNLATSSPVVAGELVFLVTSNGVDEGHLNLPSPTAPAFIAVNWKSGELAWEASVEHRVFHGQWSSPAYGVVAGSPQVVFPGGDGWAYSFDPPSGKKLWMFNLNPPGAQYILGGRGTANEIIATPVIHDDAVFLNVGQDPEHGEGIGHLYRIDATKRGDITDSGKVWHVGFDKFNRSLSTCAIRDGLVYTADLSGFVYCFDAKTGAQQWRHDSMAAIWGSPLAVDGKVMIGTEEGELLVFQQGREEKLLAKHDMGSSVYTTPVVANGVLYITSKNTLFAIATGATSAPAAE